ncbi:MAG: VOC family protein [Chloroflexota bacterium]
MAVFKYDHLHVTSPDPTRLLELCQKAMGAKITREQTLASGARSWDVDLGGLVIRISGSTGADEALKKEGKSVTGLHHLAFAVNDLGEATAGLLQRGATFLMPPTEPSPGNKVAFMRTAEGALFELLERKP